MIGFMMLIGIVVTNAIVYIDRTEQLRREGYSIYDALIESGLNRLRPIIMTAGATIFALIPLALGLSDETTIFQRISCCSYWRTNDLDAVNISWLLCLSFTTCLVRFEIACRGC